MELSLKNYKNILPNELIKKAGKTIVRECDEVEKGLYQAYEDENNESYDVSIKVSNTKCSRSIVVIATLSCISAIIKQHCFYL